MGDVQQVETGWLLGRPSGIAVRVAPSWLILAGWLTLFYAAALARWLPTFDELRYVIALAAPVLYGVSVLLHELGHAIAGRVCGLRVRAVVQDGLGGVTHFDDDPRSSGAAAGVAFAGPAVSALLGFLAWAAASNAPGPFLHVVLIQLAVGNLLIAAFNLLPGLPLDGGHMLAAGLWRLTGDQRRATTLAAWAGLVLSAGIVSVPIVLTMEAGARPGLLGIAILLLVAGPLASAAYTTLRENRDQPDRGAITAYALARRAIVLPPSTRVYEAIRVMTARGAAAVVLTDARGLPVTVAGEEALSGVSDRKRSLISVAEVARGVRSQDRVPAGLSGVALLRWVRAEGAREYLLDLPGGGDYAVVLRRDVEAAAVQTRPTLAPA
jgi:Zn-dependent protease/CBS domain-containing protein